jgi:RNA polymerase sigma-70 factor (ECF subfamily)
MAGPTDAADFLRTLSDARAGNTAALGKLFEAVRPYLVSVAVAQVEGPLQAKGSKSDIVQDTFVEAHRILDRFYGESIEEFRAWLKGILINKARDFRRQYLFGAKRRIDREQVIPAGSGADGDAYVPPSESPSPSTQASQNEEEASLLDAVGRLPPEYQLVIQLRTWDGLPFKEVGQHLGRSEDAARMLWGRAIERLQRELGES